MEFYDKNIKNLLSLLVPPFLLAESDNVRSVKRRKEHGYGKPLNANISFCHIEYRFPFSWLHDKTLFK